MINAIEEVVREVYVQVRDREAAANAGFCTCAQCEDDVLRHTMNHLRPRYVGTTIGSAVTRVSLSLEQTRAEVAVVILDAMKRVAQNPLHARGGAHTP